MRNLLLLLVPPAPPLSRSLCFSDPPEKQPLARLDLNPSVDSDTSTEESPRIVHCCVHCPESCTGAPGPVLAEAATSDGATMPPLHVSRGAPAPAYLTSLSKSDTVVPKPSARTRDTEASALSDSGSAVSSSHVPGLREAEPPALPGPAGDVVAGAVPAASDPAAARDVAPPAVRLPAPGAGPPSSPVSAGTAAVGLCPRCQAVPKVVIDAGVMTDGPGNAVGHAVAEGTRPDSSEGAVLQPPCPGPAPHTFPAERPRDPLAAAPPPPPPSVSVAVSCAVTTAETATQTHRGLTAAPAPALHSKSVELPAKARPASGADSESPTSDRSPNPTSACTDGATPPPAGASSPKAPATPPSGPKPLAASPVPHVAVGPAPVGAAPASPAPPPPLQLLPSDAMDTIPHITTHPPSQPSSQPPSPDVGPRDIGSFSSDPRGRASFSSDPRGRASFSNPRSRASSLTPGTPTTPRIPRGTHTTAGTQTGPLAAHGLAKATPSAPSSPHHAPSDGFLGHSPPTRSFSTVSRGSISPVPGAFVTPRSRGSISPGTPPGPSPQNSPPRPEGIGILTQTRPQWPDFVRCEGYVDLLFGGAKEAKRMYTVLLGGRLLAYKDDVFWEPLEEATLRDSPLRISKTLLGGVQLEGPGIPGWVLDVRIPDHEDRATWMGSLKSCINHQLALTKPPQISQAILDVCGSLMRFAEPELPPVGAPAPDEVVQFWGREVQALMDAWAYLGTQHARLQEVQAMSEGSVSEGQETARSRSRAGLGLCPLPAQRVSGACHRGARVCHQPPPLPLPTAPLGSG